MHLFVEKPKPPAQKMGRSMYGSYTERCTREGGVGGSCQREEPRKRLQRQRFLGDQISGASLGCQGVRFRSIAPKIVSSFRMQAVSATFLGLPLAHNLS